MKIKTGLPHEKNGGYTLVLFGKPRIKRQTRAGHLVYVDCHILTATKLGHGSYLFEQISTNLSLSIQKRMKDFAKKLAKEHLKGRSNLYKKPTKKRPLMSPLFIQSTNWSGFYFSTQSLFK